MVKLIFFDWVVLLSVFEIMMFTSIITIVNIMPLTESNFTRFGLGLSAFILACVNPYFVIRTIVYKEKKEAGRG